MTLKVGDPVELVGLHPAYPTSGKVRWIVGDIYGVHQTKGALPFHNMQIEHQTVMVHKSAVRDPNAPKSLFRSLLALWRSL
jgi:hypothetical protein